MCEKILKNKSTQKKQQKFDKKCKKSVFFNKIGGFYEIIFENQIILL